MLPPNYTTHVPLNIPLSLKSHRIHTKVFCSARKTSSPSLMFPSTWREFHIHDTIGSYLFPPSPPRGDRATWISLTPLLGGRANCSQRTHSSHLLTHALSLLGKACLSRAALPECVHLFPEFYITVSISNCSVFITL